MREAGLAAGLKEPYAVRQKVSEINLLAKFDDVVVDESMTSMSSTYEQKPNCNHFL